MHLIKRNFKIKMKWLLTQAFILRFELIYIPLFTYEYLSSACRPPVIGPTNWE